MPFSSEMEFNSRLDDKNRAVCPKSTKLQSVTLQYQFYFQKFSDFLRAGTQNVHLAALYYGKLLMYKASHRINTDWHIIDMKIDDLIPFCKYFRS